MTDVNTLLLDAKREYITQLSEVMGPYMLFLLDEMIHESRHDRKPITSFQRKLQEIPKWNTHVIQGHVNAIEAKAPWLSDLIAAAFVAIVRVLSSIKLRNDKPKIRLKLPTSEAFFHKALIKLARKIYEHPELMAKSTWGARADIVRSAIERAIREMLPVRDLLQAYIGNSIDGDHTVSPTPGEEGDGDADEGGDHKDDDEDEEEEDMDKMFEETKPMTTTLEETRTVSLPAPNQPHLHTPPHATIDTPYAPQQPTPHQQPPPPPAPYAPPPQTQPSPHLAPYAAPPPASPRQPLFSDADDDDEWKRMTS